MRARGDEPPSPSDVSALKGDDVRGVHAPWSSMRLAWRMPQRRYLDRACAWVHKCQWRVRRCARSWPYSCRFGYLHMFMRMCWQLGMCELGATAVVC